MGFWRPKGLAAERYLAMLARHALSDGVLVYSTGSRPWEAAGEIACRRVDRRARRKSRRKGAEKRGRKSRGRKGAARGEIPRAPHRRAGARAHGADGGEEEDAPRGSGRLLRHRLRPDVPRRDRAGRGRAFQSDDGVRGHQLPVRPRGEPARHLLRMVPAVRLLRRRQLRAAHRGQPPHSRRGDWDEEVLPDRRPADCGVRGGVQPDTQRQDAGRRVQPGQGALPHLRRGRALRRRGGPEARPNARGRGADPRQDEKLLPNPLGGRAHRWPERAAAPREAEPVLLGRGRRERRAYDEGLRVPLLPRLQVRRQRLLLQIRRHVVPGPRARQVRQRAVGPLPRRHHRPAGPPSRSPSTSRPWASRRRSPS